MYPDRSFFRLPSSSVTWKEIVFLLGYFILFPVFSELQVHQAFPVSGSAIDAILFSMICDALSFLPKLFFYVAIVPLLLNRRFMSFGISILIYLVLYDIYLRYAVDGFIAAMRFLPKEVWRLALSAYQHGTNVLVRQSLTLTLMELLVLVSFAYFAYTLRQEKEISALTRNSLQVKLNHLKMRINPAFFLGALKYIRSLAVKRSDQTAAEVAELSELVRYMLYGAGTQVPLSRELDFVRRFVTMKRVDPGAGPDIRLLVSGEPGSMEIEALTLLPFVEQIGPGKTGFMKIVADSSAGRLLVIQRLTAPSAVDLNRYAENLSSLYPCNVSIEHSLHELWVYFQLNDGISAV